MQLEAIPLYLYEQFYALKIHHLRNINTPINLTNFSPMSFTVRV